MQPYRYERKRVHKITSKIVPTLNTTVLIALIFLIISSIIQNPLTSIEQESSKNTTNMNK